MRTALISDLHGNDVALRAVLAHIADARVDRIVCLGDVATLGPAPQRVLETLAEIACPCILGNHDEFLLEADLIRRYTEIPVIVQAVDACRAALGAAELSFIRGFQRTLDLDMDGATPVYFTVRRVRTWKILSRRHPVRRSTKHSENVAPPSWPEATPTSKCCGNIAGRCS